MDDRITDDLAGPVVRDVAAARRLVKADAVLAERLRRREKIANVATAPERDHRRMLQQQELIGDRVLLPQLHEPLLQLRAVLVRDEIEIAKLAGAHHNLFRPSSRFWSAFASRMTEGSVARPMWCARRFSKTPATNGRSEATLVSFSTMLASVTVR